MADNEDGEWLTYDEAAARLGIKADSVRRRAASRKWRRRQGNDNKARVFIPRDIIPDIAPETTPDFTPEVPTQDPTLLARLAVAEARLADALQTVIEGRKALEDMRADRDAWQRQAEALVKKPTFFDRLLGKLRAS